MSSIECVNETGDPTLDAAPAVRGFDPAARLRTRIFFGFGGTMALGLSLAGWYVGGRILVADQTPTAAAETAPVTAPAEPVSQPVQGLPVATANVQPEVAGASVVPKVPAVVPKGPEKFLEVAGLGARQDALFVKKLQAKGFHARIDAASGTDSRRILIGPFDDQTALDKAERKLEAQGILALERVY